MMQRRALLAGMGGVAAAPALAQPQAWPSRPIRLIIPYPPGGATDTLARPFAERMRARLGQAVVIENRGGAATTLGMEAGARAARHGDTLLVNAENIG
ncbi:MAG: tripartite tricarboxylate transporter substrate-binding protein [Alphaproteobacteria bacterium]